MPTTLADPLDSLVHLSHLLGAETRLVQPGGGNTSIKVGDALLVKGSGTDLRTIGRDGFTRLSLARLAPLAEAESMSDAEMMRFMAGCMLAEGPAPSVETPLHSLLPHRVIAHTHDVATMSLTNVPDATAERLVRRAVRGRDRLRPVQPARLPAGAGGERAWWTGSRRRDRPDAGAPRPGGLGRRRRAGHERLVQVVGEDRRVPRHLPARPAAGRGPEARADVSGARRRRGDAGAAPAVADDAAASPSSCCPRSAAP